MMNSFTGKFKTYKKNRWGWRYSLVVVCIRSPEFNSQHQQINQFMSTIPDDAVFEKKEKQEPGIVVPACNPNTQEAEAGGCKFEASLG
jgi:hypothetical protein